MDYKNAGVDIEAGYKSVELMKKHIAKGTMRPEVLRRNRWIFRCIFHGQHSRIWKSLLWFPELTECGTKLKLAFIMDKHDTVGIDCCGHVCKRYCMCRR